MRPRRKPLAPRVLLAVLLTLLTIAALRQLVVRAVPTVEPQAETWTVATRGDALLGARVQVLVAPVDGRVERLLPEGMRVPKGREVVRIVTDQGVTAIEQQREAAARREAWLEDQALPEARQRVVTAARRYARALERLRAGFAAAQLPNSEALQEAGQAYTEWVQARGDLARQQVELERLTARVRELERLGEEGVAVLRTPFAGTVSYAVDGMERSLAPERFLAMNRFAFQRWLTAAKERAASASTVAVEGGRVRAGTPVAKIVDSWYGLIALPAPARAIGEGWVQPGQEYTWTVGGHPVRVHVLRIDAGEDGEALVVGQINSGLPELLSRRTAPFAITWGHLEGHAVPVSALLEGRAGHRVAVVEAGRVRWLPVQVLSVENGRALVAGLSGRERLVTRALWVRPITWRVAPETGE